MPFTQIKLPNGLRTIFVPYKNTGAVTILALLPVGSRYESKQLNGASHFIEHMLFKGTNRRPTNFSIAKELDSFGAEYNAFTGKDHTGYWIKSRKDKIADCLDILSDLLFNSVFKPEDFERERGVILEEIKMYEDNPLFYIEALFEETLFGSNHPLGWTISGREENIKNIKRSEILKYKNKFYSPDKILLTVAGNFKETKVKNLIKQYFNSNKFSRGKSQKFLKIRKNNLRRLEKVKILSKETKQVQIALGCPAYSYFHPKIESLNLLAIILGGNMSSRLFSEVRVKRGLAYFINADLEIYQDIGSFVVRAGVDKEKVIETLKVILGELRKIRRSGVTSEELIRAKDYLAGKLTLYLEEIANLASWYGKQKLLTGKILTLEEKIKRLNRVTLKDIQSVSREILDDKWFRLAIIGPFKNSRPFLHILKEGI